MAPPSGTGAAPQAHAALALRPVGYADLPGWNDDALGQAMPAFRASCAQLAAGPPDRALGGAGLAAELGGTASRWRPACAAAASVPPGDAAARAFFERWMQPYAVADGAAGGGGENGLFTGYYEPELAGSRHPGPGFPTPLLGPPADLVRVDLGQFEPDLAGRHITGRIAQGRFVPYFDRAQITTGALAGRHLEMLWVSDPVDAFVLEIQGSGRVRLPDGSVVRVSYADQNGRPYVPIGRVLAQEGDIPHGQVTMQSIRAWLAAHPADAAAMMDRNPSYVFFREVAALDPSQGPPGSLGANLTPGRSVAVDRRFLPLGAPVFVATTDPLDGTPVRRLMQAQDTGGAITGPVRADIFWGWGPQAEARAGKMQARGRDFVLLPRDGAQTVAALP